MSRGRNVNLGFVRLAPMVEIEVESMQRPPIPANEDERLEALRALDVLDTDPEERFDRVTRLARKLFDVPIALVSLVDSDRQWFKSRDGLDATQTPREVSFCAHAILGEEACVVADATQDERFFDNPLVTDAPHIRFYAGQPVHAPNGCRIGTLCVIDSVPRVVSPRDLETLGDLAGLVEDELALALRATTDVLTGLSNRRGFEILSEKAFALCSRRSIPASVLYIDLDGFKTINDEQGHAGGDQALRDFASLLLLTFRQADVVARVGGDEFVVLLTGCERVEVQMALNRLSAHIDGQNRSGAKPYRLKFSTGIIGYDPQSHRNVQDLLLDADRKMYEDKRRRRLERRTSFDAAGEGE